MILQKATWDKITHEFSEEEKASMRAHITGEAICPRGWVLDEEKFSVDLKAKLKAAVAKHQPPARRR